MNRIVCICLLLAVPACGVVRWTSPGTEPPPGSSRAPVVVFDAHGEDVLWTAFSPRGNTVVSASSPRGEDRSTILVWNGASGSIIDRFPNDRFVDFAGAWASDGRQAAVGERTLHLIDVEAARNLYSFPADAYEDLRILDIDQSMPVVNYLVEKKYHHLTAVAFSPDDRYLAAGQANGIIRVWSVVDRVQIAVLLASRVLGEVRDVSFSRDGRYLAACQEDRAFTVWGFPDFRMRSIDGHDKPVTSVDFAPGGIIASGSEDGTVRLRRAGSWLMVKRIAAHSGGVADVAFTADGRFLATGGADGVVALWEVGTGRELLRLGDAGEPIVTVSFNPNAMLLAAASRNGTIRVWDLSDLGLCDDLACTPSPRFAAALVASVETAGAGASDTVAAGASGARLVLVIRNEGEGAAYNVVVMVSPDGHGPAVRVDPPPIVPQVLPGAERRISLPVVVEPDASPGVYGWTIRILEANGFHVARPLRAEVAVGRATGG